MELVIIIFSGLISILYLYLIELRERQTRELKELNEKIEKRANFFNA
jgi:hypothetical protein